MKKLIYFIVILFVSTQIYANNIVLLSPFPPGGSADQILRIIEKNLLLEGIISNIEYKPGAGGSIAATHLANSKKNNIFMLPGISLLSNQDNKNYNVFKDFEIVEFIGIEPTVLVVNSQSSIKNFNDFLEQSKLNFFPGGTAGVGTHSHLTSMIIANNNKNISLVPYRGDPNIINGILSNEIKWGLINKNSAMPLIKDKKLVPILIWGPDTLDELSGIPTAAQLKINDLSFYRWHILITNNVVDKNLKNKIKFIISSQDFKFELTQLGIQDFKIKDLDTFFLDQIKTMTLINNFYKN